MAIVEGIGLWKRYSEQEQPVLRGVSLRVESGDFLAIGGSSGSGKSTLLSIIGCLDFPTRGKLLVEGVDVSQLSDRALTKLRAEKIGFIFQSFNLVPTLTAVENVEYALVVGGVRGVTRRKRATEALESVGLAEFTRRFPRDLSGGQKQRVAIARAIVKNPCIILADEPTASLDFENSLMVLQVMKALNQSRHTTFVFSSHDPVVLKFANQCLYLSQGVMSEEFSHVA